MQKFSLIPVWSLPVGQAPTTPAGSNRVFFNQKPGTVEADRRRHSAEGPSGRAEMPSRPSSSGGSGGGGGPVRPSGGSGMGRVPGGLGGLSIGGFLILLVIFLLFSFFCNNSGGQESNPSDNTSYQQATQEVSYPVIEDTLPALENDGITPQPRPTRTPRQAQPAAASQGDAQTWTVMLYQDADDPTLEQDIYMDLNEAESVGSSAQVNVVTQIDRYKGGYQGDGDWSNTRRYYLTPDDDLFHVHSKMVADIGEVSMADPQTLVDFATWAIETYPADKYVLILSDHGMGWPGGMTDPNPAGKRPSNIPFSQAVEDNLMLTQDMDDALAQIIQSTGIDRFELVGMDACLMSHIEVYSALEPYARYAVTSQETEPALGWAYTSMLRGLTNNPGMDGAELGKLIVSSYIEGDQRIVDDEARQDFLRQGSPMSSLFSQPQDIDPAQLTRQIEKSITLTAADMQGVPALMDSLSELAYVLQKENPSVVARARTYAQSYTSIFGKDVPPSYIDLANFAQLLQQESSSAAVRSAAQAVIDQVNQVVIAEKHGREKSGSNGISIYFPNSTLYRNAMTGAKSYTQVVKRFAQDSLWDDFLAYHYNQRSFQIDSFDSAVPGSGDRAVEPGSGQIQVSQLSLSATEADYNQPITMQATLQGANIGYVYLFVGYYDPNSSSILVADRDYLSSPTTRKVGDLFYPVWSDDQVFNLKYKWTPSVFSIDDGKTTAVALMEPVQYGASSEEAVYSVDGIYTDQASGDSRYARLYFSNGVLQRMYAFTGMEAVGALSEVYPQTGDQVTLIQTWLQPDGSGSYTPTTENGQTLTFGSQMFTWKEQYAAAGDYVLGFIVTDLAGNEKQTFGKVTIR